MCAYAFSVQFPTCSFGSCICVCLFFDACARSTFKVAWEQSLGGHSDSRAMVKNLLGVRSGFEGVLEQRTVASKALCGSQQWRRRGSNQKQKLQKGYGAASSGLEGALEQPAVTSKDLWRSYFEPTEAST